MTEHAMTTDHHHTHVSALQWKLKTFSIWIEGKFGQRLGRGGFLLRTLIAAAIFYLIIKLNQTVLAHAHWAIGVLSGIVFALVAFWLIIQIVCRLRDFGRSGQLFWAIIVPFFIASRIAEVAHLPERFSERKAVAIFLLALCAHAIWVVLQLFLAPSKPDSSAAA